MFSYERCFTMWNDSVWVEFFRYPNTWKMEVTYMGIDRYDNDFEVTKSWVFDTLHESIEWLRDLMSSEDHMWSYMEEEYYDMCRDYYDDDDI